MRILHVILSLAEAIGGPARALATLACAQAAAGHEVCVLPCRRLPGPQTLEHGTHGRLSVGTPLTDAPLLLPCRPLRDRLAELARRAEIIHIHGTWRYHVLAAAEAADAAGIRYLVRPAGNLGVATRRHKAWLKMPYFRLIERPVLNRAAAIHCCSEKERRELSGLGLRPRTFVVPMPVQSDLRDIAPDEAALARSCPNLPADAPVLLYLGRVAWTKQLDVLLEAFIALHHALPEWHLVIAGPHEDASISAALRRRIDETGLARRVWLPGLVRRGAKAALLRRAALYVQPSAHENFGMSVAEAMLFGIPCVVTQGVALADAVEASGAGLVCAPRADSIAAALRRMMCDADLRHRSGQAALRLAERFTPQHVVAQLDREYRRCLSG